MIVEAQASHGFLYKIFKIIILLMYLDSMYPWYMWNNSLSLMTRVTCLFIILVVLIRGKVWIQTTRANIYQCGFVLLYFCAMFFLWGGTAGNIVVAAIFISISVLTDNVKHDLVTFITKWFGILILISSCAYLLNFFHIESLPHEDIVYHDGRYESENYYLFIKYTTLSLAGFARFQSIFMEPGHMTMGIVPLLIINRFNLKNKYVLFLFIGEIMSFSLAGIITMTVGYLMLNLSIKNVQKVLVGLGVVVVLGIIVSNTIGKDVLDQYLWRRIEFADGVIKIHNNRTKGNFDHAYNQVMKSDDKWFGRPDIDRDQGDGGNAGVKVYLVMTGIVGVVLMFLMYFNYFFFNREWSIRVLIIINILLLSQSGGPLWFCSFASYVLGVGYLRTNKRFVQRDLISNSKNEGIVYSS